MENLVENTKIASYYIWEYSESDNALDYWYCAEEIASFLESKDVLSSQSIKQIRDKGKYNLEYMEYIRNIAYRVYLLTQNEDSRSNWYMAERLINNIEWCDAISYMAICYNKAKKGEIVLTGVLSEKVRNYYGF